MLQVLNAARNVGMHASLDVNMPNYASAIVRTQEIVASISAL